MGNNINVPKKPSKQYVVGHEKRDHFMHAGLVLVAHAHNKYELVKVVNNASGIICSAAFE